MPLVGAMQKQSQWQCYHSHFWSRKPTELWIGTGILVWLCNTSNTIIISSKELRLKQSWFVSRYYHDISNLLCKILPSPHQPKQQGLAAMSHGEIWITQNNKLSNIRFYCRHCSFRYIRGWKTLYLHLLVHPLPVFWSHFTTKRLYHRATTTGAHLAALINSVYNLIFFMIILAQPMNLIRIQPSKQALITQITRWMVDLICQARWVINEITKNIKII